MIHKLIVMLLPACLASTPLATQNDNPRIVIEGNYQAFTTDELGNIYAVQGDEVIVFDVRGRSWLRNSLKTFGRISTLDAYYSLKPMVFSRDMGQLAVLDNTLGIQGSLIDLTRSGMPQAVLACMSVQNCFWFFDERDLALIRTDAQMRQMANTGRLDQQLGFTPKPLSMQEHDKWLYVNDPKEGILVFDLFGTYARTLPLKGVKNFQVRDKLLYFLDATGFQVYDMTSFQVQPFPLITADMENALDMRVEKGRLYIHRPDRIVIQTLPRTP